MASGHQIKASKKQSIDDYTYTTQQKYIPQHPWLQFCPWTFVACHPCLPTHVSYLSAQPEAVNKGKKCQKKVFKKGI